MARCPRRGTSILQLLRLAQSGSTATAPPFWTCAASALRCLCCTRCAAGIASMLNSAGFNGVSLAAAMAQLVGRIVQPGYDLSTHRWVRKNSALPELWGFDFGRMSMHRMYEVSSRLWAAKPKLEQAIYGTLQTRFGLNNTVALYDLTNTYFEGLGTKNPSAVRGCSKEKRSDEPLMSLGLVFDSATFHSPPKQTAKRRCRVITSSAAMI